MKMASRLDKFTSCAGWVLWFGLYVFNIGLFFYVLEMFSPVASWQPATWNMGKWLMAFSLGIIGSIGYTLIMLLAVYGVKKILRTWRLKEQRLRSDATASSVKKGNEQVKPVDANKSN